MRIELNEGQLENALGGVEIFIKGFKGNLQEHPDETTHIFIEKFDDKVQIHVWNGTQDPETFVLQPLTAEDYRED